MNKSAFTLLEILVVLVIVSVLLGLLISSITSFRTTIQMQQGTDQTIAGIKETLNFANNNILPDGLNLTPADTGNAYAYLLSPIESYDIERELCVKASVSDWVCPAGIGYNTRLISDSLRNVRVTFDGCDQILVVNLTRDIRFRNGTTTVDSGECSIKINHVEDAEIFRTIVFDAQTNDYEVKYGDY